MINILILKCSISVLFVAGALSILENKPETMFETALELLMPTIVAMIVLGMGAIIFGGIYFIGWVN